jgi:uracil-DNA glycosylase family 4
MHEDNIKQLKVLEDEIRKCNLCPLRQYRKNAVPGEGAYNSKIMFIGEAPGEEEDKQGRPFVGKAGQVLNEILKEVGIKREEVFITNVVKCRPPHNREPNDEESNTCIKNYLEKQIELIKPSLIVLLGNVAIKYVLKLNEPSKIRGKKYIKNNTIYFPTYHPAVALYNPKMKDALLKDFKTILSIYNEIKNKKINLPDFF